MAASKPSEVADAALLPSLERLQALFVDDCFTRRSEMPVLRITDDPCPHDQRQLPSMAPDDMMVNQLASDVMFMSLENDNNFERVARTLALKLGHLDTSEYLHINITASDAWFMLLHLMILKESQLHHASPVFSSSEASRLGESFTNKCLARRLLKACVAGKFFTRPVNDAPSYATKSAVDLERVEPPAAKVLYTTRMARDQDSQITKTNDSSLTMAWTTAIDQRSHTPKMNDPVSLWLFLSFAANEYEIYQLQICSDALEGTFRSSHSGLLAFLLQEAGMDIMKSIQPPRAAHGPTRISIDDSSHPQTVRKSKIPALTFGTGYRATFSNSPPVHSSGARLVTSGAANDSAPQHFLRGNAQRTMSRPRTAASMNPTLGYSNASSPSNYLPVALGGDEHSTRPCHTIFHVPEDLPAIGDAISENRWQNAQNDLPNVPSHASPRRLRRMSEWIDLMVPCPIRNCPGKDATISEVLRKLKTSQHGKFICSDCWCVFATLKDLDGHIVCEVHCVLETCNFKPWTTEGVRHKYDRISCVDKGDRGRSRQTRKEQEYLYLCRLLGSSPKSFEQGRRTAHRGQRKSPSQNHAAQDNQVIEANRVHELLELRIQELQRHNGRLETVTQDHRDREKELVQILQQALEEHEGENPRISKALYRRIEHRVPHILEELPRTINPFGDATPPTRSSSSESSPEPYSRSSYGNLLRNVPFEVARPSIPSPSQRTPSAQAGVFHLSESTKLPQSQEPPPDQVMVGTTQLQRQYESTSVPSTSPQMPLNLPESRAQWETATSLQLSSTYVAPDSAHIPAALPLENWESESFAFQPQDSTTGDPTFYDMHFPGGHVINGTHNTQEPDVWDEASFADFINAPTYSGEGFGDDLFGDFPTS